MVKYFHLLHKIAATVRTVGDADTADYTTSTTDTLHAPCGFAPNL